MTHRDPEYNRQNQPVDLPQQPDTDFCVGEPGAVSWHAPVGALGFETEAVLPLTAEDARRTMPRLMDKYEEMFRILAQ
jgi:hypothetical protein